jgi:hypothetical protein
MMESFWGTIQFELFDARAWTIRIELVNAIFEWIECWYNPNRRHSSIGMRSPVTFEALHTGVRPRSLTHTGGVRRTGKLTRRPGQTTAILANQHHPPHPNKKITAVSVGGSN